MNVRPEASDGLTARERGVLSRWDRGESKQRIVRETGLRRSDVDRIISMFNDSDAELTASRVTRAASDALAAACIATGSCFR